MGKNKIIVWVVALILIVAVVIGVVLFATGKFGPSWKGQIPTIGTGVEIPLKKEPSSEKKSDKKRRQPGVPPCPPRTTPYRAPWGFTCKPLLTPYRVSPPR